MSAHLLAIAVGPVQEFIAAARRTRDLWFGSYLLSEVSKAIARSVEESGGLLIFPSPMNPADLNPDSVMNVANVILAEIPEDKGKPEEHARTAREAARACWRSFADAVIGDEAIAAVTHRKIWNEQVDDVIEFYAAWTSVNDDYPAARFQAMRLLTGRKNCRDFTQPEQHPGLPKSSLDGMRDTVLLGPREGDNPQTYRNSWPKETRRKLRVRTGEQLDVIGLVKRAWRPEGGSSYPSVSRVAADPWLRGIIEMGGRELLKTLARACDKAPKDTVHRLNSEKFPQMKDFPQEGTTLFRSRHHEWFEETDDAPKRPDERQPPPGWYAEIDKALCNIEQFAAAKCLGSEPNPYLAVIVADGDNMGKTIAELATPTEHQAFSQELSKFADLARGVVTDHYGVLVYAGGDDVLALVPVDKCLDCARQLHDSFGKLMTDLVNRLNGNRKGKLEATMTLSVGVAIGHFLENLEDLRAYGQAAEKHAKTPDPHGVKDALAVHLHKRGGGPIRRRSKWTDFKPTVEHWANAPDTRITQLAELLRLDLLPNRLATDLNRMANVYDGWPRKSETEKKQVENAIKRDVLRLIAAKQSRGSESVQQQLQPALAPVKDAASLRQLAEELLIARQIATACRQAASPAKERKQ